MSPKEKSNTERINIFLSPKVLDVIKREAETRGMSVSGLVRMIVMEWITKEIER